MSSARQMRADARDAVRQAAAFAQTDAPRKAASEYTAYVQQNFLTMTSQHNAFAHVPIHTLIKRVSLVSSAWRTAGMHHELYREYKFDFDVLMQLSANELFNDTGHAFRAWMPSICTLRVASSLFARSPRGDMFESLMSNERNVQPMHHVTELILTSITESLRVHVNFRNHPRLMCCMRGIRHLRLGTIENLELACLAPNLHTVSVNLCWRNENLLMRPGRDIVTDRPFDCRRLCYARTNPFPSTVGSITILDLRYIGTMTRLRSLTIMEHRCRITTGLLMPDASILCTLLRKQKKDASPLSVLDTPPPSSPAPSLNAPPSEQCSLLSTISLRIARKTYETQAIMERFAQHTQIMLTEVNFASPRVRVLDLSGWCVALNEPVGSPLCDDAHREYVLQWLVRCFPRLECLYMCEFRLHTHAWARKLLAAHPTLRVVVLDGGVTEQGEPLAVMPMPPSASLSFGFFKKLGGGTYRNVHGEYTTTHIDTEPDEDDFLTNVLEHLQFVSRVVQCELLLSGLPVFSYALVWRDGEKDATRQPW